MRYNAINKEKAEEQVLSGLSFCFFSFSVGAHILPVPTLLFLPDSSILSPAVELLMQEHEKHPDNPYMFPSPRNGEMWHPDSVVKLHEKILKDAGLEHIRFHDLRHTFATVALQNGVDVKTVSSMLGHYDAGFTLSTYAHATNRMQEKTAEKLGSFMTQVM